MHKWLLKAADQKYSIAYCQPGKACERGIGVAANGRKAFSWYEKAAELKHYDNTVRIAKACQKGELGRIANAGQAREWFKQAEDIKKN